MTRVLIAMITLVLTSWTHVPEEKLYAHYRTAIKNTSTFQYFLVVHVTDLNTGQTRDICTKGNFLQGAIHREYKLGYDDISEKRGEKIALHNRSRTFQFRNTEALNNLGLDNYSMDDLAEFEKRNAIDQLANEIDETWKKRFSDDKEMLLYAHALFNRGILTGENNCYGGTLYVISK